MFNFFPELIHGIDALSDNPQFTIVVCIGSYTKKEQEKWKHWVVPKIIEGYRNEYFKSRKR